MISHIVKSCPLTKLNGGLSRLHSANEDAVSWLTSYGSWHAYEKTKIVTDAYYIHLHCVLTGTCAALVPVRTNNLVISSTNLIWCIYAIHDHCISCRKRWHGFAHTDVGDILYGRADSSNCRPLRPRHVLLAVSVDVSRHPAAASVSNCVKVRFAPPKDIPVELYIKVFVGYKTRYRQLSSVCACCIRSTLCPTSPILCTYFTLGTVKT